MRRLLAAACALLAAAPLAAEPTSPDYRAIAMAWQAHEARLLSIGWRLARSNAPLCSNARFAIGLMLGDVRTTPKPDLTRAALGMAGDIAVEAVASSSPAEAAGLQAGDEVLEIASEPVTADPREKIEGGARLTRLHDRIDQVLGRSGTVTLTVASPRSAPRDVTIAGEPACPGRFELQRWGQSAQADGKAVRIAVRLLAETPADDEAAAMIAHELAHTVLGHVATNNAAGRSYLVVRRNERIADRMAPWLMVNAGFDPAAAPRFMLAWGARHDPGITRAPTHDGYRDRAGSMTAELPEIAAARAGRPQGLIDWRQRFPMAPGK